jgi:dephospho-CoA kinase
MLGITGGIGSGKSTALAFLHELGAAVLSSDKVVHDLYERPEIVAAVRERFGPDVVHNTAVDRGAVARVVFADPEALAWLEALLHPHVREAIAAWADAQAEAVPQPIVLAVEVPLLFESGFAADFDFTVLITAPVDARRLRLAERFSEEDLERRLRQQMPEVDKAALADFVFVNDDSRRELKEFLRATVAHVISVAPAEEAS